MSYEILNEVKTNVGERPLFEALLGKKRGSGLAPEKFLEVMPLRRRKISRPPRCRLLPSFVLFQTPNLLSLEGNRPLVPLDTSLRFKCVLGLPHIPICWISTEWIVDFSYKIEIWIDMKINIKFRNFGVLTPLKILNAGIWIPKNGTIWY